jgi:hypothetical protein
MRKINLWLFSAIIACSLIGLTCVSCTSSDDNPIKKTQSNDNLVGTWLVEYEDAGTVNDDQTGKGSFKYSHVIDLLQFQADGTGCMYRCFFNDEDADDILNLGIVWGDKEYGNFHYTFYEDYSIKITFDNNKNAELPSAITAQYESDHISIVRSKTRVASKNNLIRVGEDIEALLEEWKDKDNEAANEVTPEDLSDAKYEVIRDGVMWYHEIVANVVKGSVGRDKMLEEIVKGSGVVGTRGIRVPTTIYRYFDYKYQSVDAQNKPITLSARVLWGGNKLWKLYEAKPDYILLSPHFTIADEYICPTSGRGIESLFMAGNLLLILPDYLGFGVTKDSPQPYVNHGLCAQNSIDALTAGYHVFCDKANVKMENDWKLYVAGVSQGGGNALAIHKWLDTHESFADNWRFAYSYCGAGPYSPSLTFREYFKQKKHPYPVVFPIVIKSMMMSYPEILGKYKEEDFFSDSYLSHKAEIDEMVNSKLYTSDQINTKFFSYYPHTGESDVKGGEEILLTDILSTEAQDLNSDICKALFECFDKNDLTTGWTPKHPIYLFHGKSDQIVPYANAQAVVDAFPADKVTLYTEKFGLDDHQKSCLQFFLHMLTANW